MERNVAGRSGRAVAGHRASLIRASIFLFTISVSNSPLDAKAIGRPISAFTRR